jgi:hypothetical protein
MKSRWLLSWCLGEITILSRLTAKHTPYLVTMFRPDGAWLTGCRATGSFSTRSCIATTSRQVVRCEQLDNLPSEPPDVDGVFHRMPSG